MNRKQRYTRTTSAEAGAAVYTKRLLSVYDLAVIKVSNRLAWRCPAHRTLSFYNQHISANHLEVGVGTGYYLDRSWAVPLFSPLGSSADAGFKPDFNRDGYARLEAP